MVSPIPKSWRAILWSVNIGQLDWEKDKVYIIHQVLMYGSLENIRHLLEHYGRDTVSRIFVSNPKNIYTPQAFNFIKNYILKIDEDIAPEKYARNRY